MNLAHLMDTVKKHPDYGKAGMILCHNGVVRGTSRDGREVSGFTMTVDREKLRQIIAKQKQRPGIVEIFVEIAEGELSVGDDVMLLVVAGDIRENVISVLSDTLNAIKSTVTRKTEFFV